MTKLFEIFFHKLSLRKTILIIIVSAGVIYMLLSVFAFDFFASDFDKFAKKTIKELGNSGNSEHQKATNAVLEYLRKNGIEDPISFFQENMDGKYMIDADDPNLSRSAQSDVQGGKVKTYTSFSSYFNLSLLVAYEFVIHVRDFRSGERKITVQIYYRGV